ncbi:MAG: hypothetical protein M3Q20_00500 [Actinomycetota bacterium]|nr:hypothetical protein [Actinomycetota bacterium]
MELDREPPLAEPAAQQAQLDVDDLRDLVPAEGVEDHDLIDAVDEFWPEVLADVVEHGFLLLVAIERQVREDR